MITIEQGMKISAIIDKIGLELPTVTKDLTQEELGASLMFQVVSKAHKAEAEVYDLVSDVKGCTKEEAKKVNLLQFIQDLINTEGVQDFLSSAVTSQATE